MVRTVKRTLTGACAAVVIAGCSAGGTGAAQATSTGWSPAAVRTKAPGVAHATPRVAPLTGAYLKGMPGSAAPLATFGEQTGTQPRLALYFSGWGESFKTSFATAVARGGGISLVQIEPGNVPVASIASGAQDQYLDSFAQQVRAFGHPVILSFGHEMNGTWYQWGWTHTAPATFIAAWRHIVTVFRDQGATSVTWMWTVQAAADAPASTASPAAWWPGSDYVTWVGIDGHFTRPRETFRTLFDPAIADVRRVTSKPILIGETAIAPSAGQPATIADLFAGVVSQGVLGFVYFDAKGNYDYRLQTPAALGAFRAAAKKYGA